MSKDWYPNEEKRTSFNGTPYFFYCNVGRDDDSESVYANQFWGVAIDADNLAQFLLSTEEKHTKLVRGFAPVQKLRLDESTPDKEVFVSSSDATFYDRLRNDAELCKSIKSIIQIGVASVRSMSDRLAAEIGDRSPPFLPLEILSLRQAILLPRQKTLNTLIDRLMEMKNLFTKVAP